jgi:hypothetical protein
MMSVDPGWVLHESGQDETGYEGWLYHYADGAIVAEDGSPVELADPGWVFHESDPDGAGYDGWLYHYADGAIVTETGSPYEETDPPPPPAAAEAPVVPEPSPSLAPVSPPPRQPQTRVRRRVLSTLAGWQLDLRLVSLRAVEAMRRMLPRAAPYARIAGLLAVVLVLVAGVALVHHRARADRVDSAGSLHLDPPAGLPANGEYVLSRVRVTGDVAVEHWIHSTRLVSSVTLTVPSAVPHSGSGVVARNVLLESDGEVRRGADLAGAARRTISLDGANLVRVSYVLSGVVVRSSSARDRALAGVTALDLSYHRDRVPRTLVVQGGRLLSAACSTPTPDAEPRPCGDPDGMGWRVHLRPSARDDRVMVQLDMP